MKPATVVGLLILFGLMTGGWALTHRETAEKYANQRMAALSTGALYDVFSEVETTIEMLTDEVADTPPAVEAAATNVPASVEADAQTVRADAIAATEAMTDEDERETWAARAIEQLKRSRVKETSGAGAPADSRAIRPHDAGVRTLVEQADMKDAAPARSAGAEPLLPINLPESIPAPAETPQPAEKIQDIGASLRKFQHEARKVEEKVRETVSREVESARMEASRKAETLPVPAVPEARPFDADERAERIQEITNAISRDARESVVTSDAALSAASRLEPVLKSSLKEIQALIADETGITVDLSPSARTLVEVVQEAAPQVASLREELKNRGGLELYRDSDGDGISDYDEKHIYGTDPHDAFTAGTALTDGERVLLGFDPLTDSVERVPVESPRIAGAVITDVFEVHAINVALKPVEPLATAPAVASGSDEPLPPSFAETVTFSGRALPNSFVTLYIFSTPVVVTVKTDQSGAWTYTLDTELPDGEHELYVATVDAGGRILAKSPAVPFVKRAEAAAFTPLLLPPLDEVSAFEVLQENFLISGAFFFLVFLLIATIVLGVARFVPKEPGASS